MINYNFSIYHFEYFLAIVVRIMGAMVFAPVFGNIQVTRRVRIFLGVALAMIVFLNHPYKPLPYTTMIGYSIMLVGEAVMGLTMGFMANMVISIINMAGQFIDREMGFSMVSSFDPTFNTEATISAQFYMMLVSVLLVITDAHKYIITAVTQSFDIIPLGGIKFNSENVCEVCIKYMSNYFLIALRISLPVLVVVLLLNAVLGVLAKTAPQMSLFSIGIQLKILGGFTILYLTVMFLPNITNFLYEEMKAVINETFKIFYS